ncbi:MAG: hypothetical protein ACOYNZ_14075 [Rhodoferax sp.]
MICVDRLNLDVDLGNLTGVTLLKVALLFALVSPVMPQLWFTLRGLTENHISSMTAMFIGDLPGTIFVLYAAKLVLTLLPASEWDGKSQASIDVQDGWPQGIIIAV